MAALIIFLSALIVYYSLRLYKRYNFRKHQLQLFALRDELRELAITNKVNSSNWVFKYLDSSISKSVHTFGQINIWYALYLSKVHKKDDQYVFFKKQLDLILDKHPDLKHINIRYIEIISEYVWNRHALSILIVGTGLNSLFESLSFCRNQIKKVTLSVRNVTTLPETSTSENFLKKAGLC
jgi:hypothetical protein